MAEKLTKERFAALAAFERVLKDQQQLSGLTPEALKGTMLVTVAAGQQLALSKEDVAGMLSDTWDEWAQYRAVCAALAKRKAK